MAERRAEIEAAAQVRIRAVSDPGKTGDPVYVEGLRAALSAALDFALAGLEDEDGARLPIPAAMLVQARLAARSRVSLDTVLRRYFAGYTLLGDFLMQEANAAPSDAAALQHLLRSQAELFDRLIAAVTEEHTSEWERRPGSTEERRLKRIEDLLDGELCGGEELNYDFDRQNLGLIANGLGGAETVHALALELDCQLLLVRSDEGTVWAWLGTGEIDMDAAYRLVIKTGSPDLLLAMGEPAQGLPGWRLTYRQAKASLAIGMRTQRSVVRYADIALLSSVLEDQVLATTLREMLLAPLIQGGERGVTLVDTLRAYFVADRNVSSAAAALRVSRQTVINRLNAVEERLGRSLTAFAPELELALRLEEFDRLQVESSARAADLGPLQPVKLDRASLDALPKRATLPV